MGIEIKEGGEDFAPKYKKDMATSENAIDAVISNTKSHADLIEELRRERIPFSGKEQKLSFNGLVIPGYHLHVFNDEEGRIQRAMQAGYRHVTRGEVLTNNSVTPINNDPGSNVRIAVGGTTGGGDPLYGYLMKIPQELWDEDQLSQQTIVDSIDKAIGRGVSDLAFNAEAGNAEAMSKAYTPTDKKTGHPSLIKQTTSFVRPNARPS